ncbi:MerR family transcriptional regulator [Pseudonocardia yuanmonensis]|uniref:MerR family transcriptional regulator n=1 Tax=Pseudonocardia yuanmonensis TaxID=1095914 RepID=UPI0031EECC78
MPISSAARGLGIEPATLRVWQRRYGLGASHRSAGGHRRYTDADLARLRTVRDLVDSGMRTGDAARVVLAPGWAAPTATSPGTRDVPGPEWPPLAEAVLPAAPSLADSAARAGPSEYVDLLVEAALNLDEALLASLLAAHLTGHGSYLTWETLLRPALRGVDSCRAGRPDRVAAEHLLSQLASAVLLTRSTTGGPGPSTALPADPIRRTRTRDDHRVVLACAPTEQHALPLLALGACLADAAVPTLTLGARTPTVVLRRLAEPRALGQEPCLIVVLAVRPTAADAAILTPHGDEVTWIAAGPGWQPRTLPPGVLHANGLAAASSAVHALLDGVVHESGPVADERSGHPASSARQAGTR